MFRCMEDSLGPRVPPEQKLPPPLIRVPKLPDLLINPTTATVGIARKSSRFIYKKSDHLIHVSQLEKNWNIAGDFQIKSHHDSHSQVSKTQKLWVPPMAEIRLWIIESLKGVCLIRETHRWILDTWETAPRIWTKCLRTTLVWFLDPNKVFWLQDHFWKLWDSF